MLTRGFFSDGGASLTAARPYRRALRATSPALRGRTRSARASSGGYVDDEQDGNNQRRERHRRTDEPWHGPANGKSGEPNDEPRRCDEFGNQGKAFWREHALYLGCAGAVGEEPSYFVAPAASARS
jgi:hypothetical protein